MEFVDKLIVSAGNMVIEKLEKTNPMELITMASQASSWIKKTIVEPVINSVAEMKDGFLESRENYKDKKRQAEERLKIFAQEIKNASWQSMAEKTSECISFVDKIDLTDEKQIENACLFLNSLENIISDKFMEMR